MEIELTNDNYQMILESLSYTKKKIEEATTHPSYEFKLERMKEVETLIQKVRILRNETN
jgi:hypothetical protein